MQNQPATKEQKAGSGGRGKDPMRNKYNTDVRSLVDRFWPSIPEDILVSALLSYGWNCIPSLSLRRHTQRGWALFAGAQQALALAAVQGHATDHGLFAPYPQVYKKDRLGADNADLQVGDCAFQGMYVYQSDRDGRLWPAVTKAMVAYLHDKYDRHIVLTSTGVMQSLAR